MYIAAIHNLPERKDEMAGGLAAVLGTTLYEARSRLRVPGSGPFVIALHRERNHIETIVKRLQEEGFDAFMLDPDEIESGSTGFIVRKFRFDDEGLYLESPEGEHMIADYTGIELILRGTSIALSTETESVKKRKFSLGRTLLSGGLVMSKTTKVTRQVSNEDREGFFCLYYRGRPTGLFFERALVYDSLGPALMPSRPENFSRLLNELRQRQPGAAFDDRLLRRPDQAALLGPLLSPEENLDVAISLLAKEFLQKNY